jgi:hypothetical protein
MCGGGDVYRPRSSGPCRGRSRNDGGRCRPQQLASQLQASRLATAKYATNLTRAKKDGYGIITQMIPDMGWHFLDPKITGPARRIRRPAPRA